MANHKSSEKRIRQTQVRNLRNRYYAKTARNAVRKLRATTVKEEAAALYVKVSSCLLYTSPSPRDGATSRMPSSA